MPLAGPAAIRTGRTIRRYSFARSYYRPQMQPAMHWARLRTEDTNFYYSLTERNESTLASLVAVVAGIDVAQAESYMSEVKEDASLRGHLTEGLVTSPDMRDAVPLLGRRIGWYAFVRALKPRLVVETGVALGVGSCVICAALLRNRYEGSPGRYVGTEIDPGAGQLLTAPYSTVGSISYGDSIASLEALTDPIDIFINDSDHSAEYEAREYETLLRVGPVPALILGDNSHVTTALRDFAVRNGRPFLFFREEPADHWYPGAGIGVSPTCLPLRPLQARSS
jgi:hypothetical protein